MTRAMTIRRKSAGVSAMLVALAPAMLLAPQFTAARVLKSIGQSWQAQEQSLTVGGGLDFQSDEEETEYDFALLIEYGFSETFKATVEPNYIHLAPKDGSAVSGFGEMEASLSYDFLAPEETRPGLSALGIVKLPTASKDELGTGEPDFTIGLGAFQEFEHVDADFNALYTLVSSPPGMRLRNSVEFILAGEWYATEVVSLMAELAAMDGAGRSHAQSGSIQGLAAREGGSERSVTLGVAEQLAENVRLEQGLVYVLDGTVQAVIAWEWTIGGP